MANRLKIYLANLNSNRLKRKETQSSRLAFVIHPVTLLLCVASIFVGMFWLFFTYLICLLFHEFCHAVVAKKLGYRCTKITLYPSGALLAGDTDEFTFKDEIIISLAGPLCNILLIIICIFLWWIFPEIYNYTADFVVANLSLALFNLLPIFPLDGGRCLLAFLSKKMPRKNALKIAKNITTIFALLLFLLFVISLFFTPNFQIGFASIGVFFMAITDGNGAVYKRIIKSSLKRRRLKHGLPVKTLLFNKQTLVSRVLSKIDNFAYYNIVVVDDDYNPVKSFTEKELEDLALSISPTSKVGDII